MKSVIGLSYRQIIWQNRLIPFALLCLIGLAAWLSTLYPLETDLTRNTSNTLSEASIKLIQTMPEPITITAYIKRGLPIRLQIAQLITRYQRYKNQITLNFVDPDDNPEKTRELGIGTEGMILIKYRGHTEKLGFIDESALTNALLQLATASQRWITFLTGHGERALDGIANFDWGQFSNELALRKITVLSLNLATMPSIASNSQLLIIAAPAVPLLPGELAIIKQYVEHGGNLLLLSDPDNNHVQALQQQLGIRSLPGVIVDTETKLYGIDNPTFVLANAYPDHPITRGLQIISLYPIISAFEYSPNSGFTTKPLLKSMPKTWLETGASNGAVSFDANTDLQGPLTTAYALTRIVNNQEQRIVVIGDSDFLSNTYLGNVGNLDVGLRIINWLTHNDQFIDIPAKVATDKTLQLTPTTVAMIGFGFLIFIPVALTGTGIIIWRQRKRR